MKGQTDDDAKIANIARSFGTLKSALRLWFKSYAFREEVSKSSYVRLHSSPVWHITDHDTDNTIQGG